MEDEARDLRPIRPLRVGVKDAQIRHEVLFVIAGQNICVRSGVGTGGSSGGWGMRRPTLQIK
jgi:hypothetical protein